MQAVEIPTKQKNWLDLIKYKPYAFGLETGFTDLSDIHNDWIKTFLFSGEDITLQAHRGSYKTTCLSIAIAIMLVAYPKENIIMLRKADDDVKEVVNQIGKMLQTDFFQQMAYELYGTQLVLTKQSAVEIDTNLKATARGTSQLLGMGIGGSLTGKHGDIIVTDDIINLQDRISRATRERTKLVYQELQNIKNPGGRFINTGTPWHIEDAFDLMPNPHKFSVYDTGLLANTEIQKLRELMTPSLFAANYELKHIADQNAMFTNPIIDDGTNTEMLFDGIAHIDAAYGGEDNTAFTIAKQHGDTIYVYGKMWQKHVEDCLGEILYYHKEYRAGTIYNEFNADKGYLNRTLNARNIPAETYHEGENKFMKIATILRREWANIIFIDGTDPEYISQVLDFTENAQHDDAPDSLASILRVFEKKGKSNFGTTYKALRKGLGRR